MINTKATSNFNKVTGKRILVTKGETESDFFPIETIWNTVSKRPGGQLRGPGGVRDDNKSLEPESSLVAKHLASMLKVLELISALANERRSTKIKICTQDVPEFMTD